MDPGGLAQMSHAPFNTTQNGLPMPNAGLASRRGQGQGIKPLSFDAVKAQNNIDNGVPTPRTSRSHLLAGLRTAPKSATAASFNNGPASPTVIAPSQGRNRNSMIPGMYDNTNLYNGPKTSLPRYGAGQQQLQQQQQQQQQQQHMPQLPGYNLPTGYGQQQYATDQVLAPQIQLEGVENEQIDFQTAQLMYNSAYLRDQQERLQNQIRLLQQAAQQFQGLSINGQPQMMQQAYPNVYQQQAQNLQNMMTPAAQPNVYVGYDQTTGQQMLFMDQSQAQLQAQLNSQYINQTQAQLYAAALQQQQQQQAQQAAAPRVQVSPPPEARNSFRSTTPPRRYESPNENTVPLPPPSANAFRRGHKKSPSLANNNTANKSNLTISTSDESPKTGGLKTSTVPMTPLTSGYGPGQARAGEHPVRQPRNPPSLDELKSKPTAKHDGSKNFVTRTRRSAVTNLVRAGLERRKEARSSGSISPISESTEEMIETPMTDNDSDSGRSGSGSLIERDDAECSLPSSRTSTGSWGAIGSDRPSSRQKLDRRNPDSAASSDNEGSRDPGSFASLLKNSARQAKAESVEGQRKAAMLVLTSAEKRKVVA
ncbi:hypothetical protein QBC43DRAFT_49971 [Cladorrhinum sp. PSN259]|nr:hypothetical protein QBC43DRAFT_49971 [Cladorrhinum sp. PSN259]